MLSSKHAMTPTITTGVNLQVVKIEAHLDVDVKVVQVSSSALSVK